MKPQLLIFVGFSFFELDMIFAKAKNEAFESELDSNSINQLFLDDLMKGVELDFDLELELDFDLPDLSENEKDIVSPKFFKAWKSANKDYKEEKPLERKEKTNLRPKHFNKRPLMIMDDLTADSALKTYEPKAQKNDRFSWNELYNSRFLFPIWENDLIMNRLVKVKSYW